MAEGLDNAFVGQSTPPSNGRMKVTGGGRFPPDYAEPGMLHVAVLRSDVPHARIHSLDLSAVHGRGGIAAVVTRRDLGLDDVVRHCGDVIAAVAGTSEEEARHAVTTIEVELERLPVISDPTKALDSDVNLDPDKSTNLTLQVDHEEGDVDQASASADVVYEATYEVGRPTHCNLSPRTCIARADSNGAVEVMTSVDAPFFARGELAEWLGLPLERVSVVLPELLTSSFGGRTGINRQCEPIAAQLALHVQGRPVRLKYEPEEEFIAGTTRHPMIARLSAAATADGDLTALQIDVLADHGPYPDFVSRIVLSASRDRPIDLYAAQNYRFRGRSVLTNNLQAGEMRGIGATQITYLLGIHLDELARRLDMDPLEFHLHNLSETARPSITACLERGRSAFGWDDEVELQGTRQRGIGLGLGCHTTGLGTFHGPDRATAVLTLETDGRVTVDVSAPDSGQGNSTIWTQIVSEEMSIPVDNVLVGAIDTSRSPPDAWGSIASRSTYVVGSAVKAAAQELRQKVMDAAMEVVDDSDPTLARGLLIGSADSSAPLAAVAHLVGPVRVSSEAVTQETPPTFGAYFSEVAVDPETGVVELGRFTAVLDVGRAINPAQCIGQIEGAIAMGAEFGLAAEVVVREGFPENVSLVDYPLAMSSTMPEIEVILVEEVEESGPYGARGIGTPSLTPVMPAIANAVRDAIGHRLERIPMTPERVWSATATQ